MEGEALDRTGEIAFEVTMDLTDHDDDDDDDDTK